MPDDSNTQDSLAPAVKTHSTIRGDVPDVLRRRYYTDELGGGGLGFYADARIQTPAFRDRGRDLVAVRLDPNAIRDMAAIAKHRDWSIVTASGSAEFRREAWLAGRSIGLEVRGYRATERDTQELQRRQERAQRAEEKREVRTERREAQRDHLFDEREVRRERREDAGARAQLRVIDAVLRARIGDPERQERVMAAARNRVADWLERGARIEPLRGLDRSESADRTDRRDRQRSR